MGRYFLLFLFFSVSMVSFAQSDIKVDKEKGNGTGAGTGNSGVPCSLDVLPTATLSGENLCVSFASACTSAISIIDMESGYQVNSVVTTTPKYTVNISIGALRPNVRYRLLIEVDNEIFYGWFQLE